MDIRISNDPEEEKPRVLSALETVFNPSSSEITTANRQAADQYLVEFQRSPVAWQLADQLLSHHVDADANNVSLMTQVHFFAAQTLHVKCRCDIMQLDPNLLPSLRDSLTIHLSRFIQSGGSSSSITRNSAVITRLAMALCALAVQMQWMDVLPHLLRSVNFKKPYNTGNHMNTNSNSNNGGGGEYESQNNNVSMVQAVLEIAKLLPEETVSDRLLVRDESQRRKFIDALIDNSNLLFQFLTHCVMTYASQSASGTGTGAADAVSLMIKEQALRCMHSWIRHIPIAPRLLQESQLVDWAFSILREYDMNVDVGDTFELAVDIVIEILRCYPSDDSRNVGLVQKMVPLVMTLGDDANNAATPFHKAIQEEDEDGMRAYCRIFTEMGESYMSLIMHHEDLNQKQLVELVLACSAIPDNEIATITLNFWYRFVTELEELQPYEWRQLQIDNFVHQVVKLVSTCTNLLRYPPDIDSLPEDRVDDVHRNRFYVTDTLEDCCRLLGGHDVIENIGGTLQREIERVSALPSQQDQLAQWHTVEACFKALIPTSRYTPSDENRVLPFAMSLIPNLTSVAHLRTTANYMVGAFAMWLNHHPDHLNPILPFLAQGLSDSKCAPSAAVAIKSLCENCSSRFSLGDSVLELYDGIVSAREQQQSMLDLKVELDVLEGACRAISQQLEEMMKMNSSQGSDKTSSYISRVVEPIGNRLFQHASNNCVAGPKAVIAEVERLTVVVRFLHVPGPSARAKFLTDLMVKCWPLLESISLHLKDFQSAEKICRFHKHCLRSCGASAYRPMLDQLRTQLVQNYANSQQSPYLYAASICITSYGNDPTCTQSLLEMLAEMGKTSFGMLRSMEDFRNHPDVVEELFFLAEKTISCCPKTFVTSPMFHPFIQCAAVAMKLDHRDANRGTLSFLESALSFGLTLQDSSGHADTTACKQALEHSLVQEGNHIATNLIQSLLGELPCYRVTAKNGSIAGIMHKLNRLCPGMLSEWIQPPLAKMSETEKAILLNSLGQQFSRDEFFSTCERFASVCSRNQKMRRL